MDSTHYGDIAVLIWPESRFHRTWLDSDSTCEKYVMNRIRRSYFRVNFQFNWFSTLESIPRLSDPLWNDHEIHIYIYSSPSTLYISIMQSAAAIRNINIFGMSLNGVIISLQSRIIHTIRIDCVTLIEDPCNWVSVHHVSESIIWGYTRHKHVSRAPTIVAII